MDELILREIEGQATAAELAELRQWRRASRENERRYHEVVALWALAGERREIDPVDRVPTAAEMLRSRPMPARTRPRRRRVMGRVAATVAAVLVVGIGLTQLTGRWQATEQVRFAEFRTGSSDLATAILDDGTVIRLAPNTRLRATLERDGREVELEGRAYFAVAHDPDRPFRVRTAGGEARVLGTRFELDTRATRLRVLVVDGAVALSAGGEEVELGAGDVGEASADAPLAVSRVDAPEELLEWLGAWVAFEATPLHQVAVELEVRLGLRVEIADDAIAERTITGWFSEEDRDAILPLVCRVAEVRCTDTGDRVLMEDPVR